MNPLISLAQIRAQHPCESGWRKVLAAYGPDLNTTISLGDIAASNDADDALWCVRCLDWSDVAVRRAVVAAIMPSVRRAAVHSTDPRVTDCITAVDRWVSGDDGVDLAAAWAAASAAAWGAWAAGSAAARGAWAAGSAAASAAAGGVAASRATIGVVRVNGTSADLIAAFPSVRAAAPAAA